MIIEEERLFPHIELGKVIILIGLVSLFLNYILKKTNKEE